MQPETTASATAPADRPAVRLQPPTATRSLVEEFKEGLDAPICLTWELTYACNLSCVHCLSSSGRRDPRELTTAGVLRGHRRARAAPGLLRQHRRRRADAAPGLLRDPRVRRRAPRRREVLHQRHLHRPGAPPSAWRRWTTSTSRSRSTAPTPTSTTRCAARARSPPPRGDGPPARRRASARSRSAWS